MHGDHMGFIGVVYMRFGKCMGTLVGHRGSFIWGLESIWAPMGSKVVVYMRYGRCMGSLGEFHI